MKNILTIAKNTWRETIRDRILMSVWFVIIGIILFSLFIGTISHDHNVRIITNFSVTAIYILQIFIALFVGSYLINKEIERKTFFLIIPKPISRRDILIGKCVGLICTAMCVSLLSTLFLILLLLISGGASYIGGVVLSVSLSLVEALLLILISLIFSSFMSPILAFVSSFSVYLISHGGEILRFIFMTTEIPFVRVLFSTLYHTIPNFEKFNIRNEIVYGTLPSPIMIGVSLMYALVYGVLLLLIAVHTFKKKEF